MNRTVTTFVGVVLLLGAVGIVRGGAIDRPLCIPYHGWITDSESGKAGANASNSKEQVEEVLSRGGQVLFYSEEEDRLYPVADPMAAIEHVGKRLTVDAHVELVVHSYSENPAGMREDPPSDTPLR